MHFRVRGATFIAVCGIFTFISAISDARGAITTNTFTSASDPALDFTGTFAYAGSMGNTSAGLPVTIGGATFTNANSLWTGNLYQTSPSLGSNPDDDKLETALTGLIYTDSTMTGTIPVTQGTQYKLQLLFLYNDRSRGTLLDIENGSQTLQFGTVPSLTTGLVATTTFTAGDGTLNIAVTAANIQGDFAQPILNGFTLEVVPEPSSLALLSLGVAILPLRRQRRTGGGRLAHCRP